MPKITIVDEGKEVVAPKTRHVYNYSINMQSVRSMVAAKIIYNGAVTGNQYEWSQAGAITSVDERDVPELLAKRLGSRTCCGSSDGNRIFELV